MTIEKRNPPEVSKPIGHYSHVAEVPAGFRLLMLAGQVGPKSDGSYPDSVEEQFEIALAGALKVAATQGAGPQDVVKLTYYVTERPREFDRIRLAIRNAFPADPPAATFLIVAGLAAPEIKAEIDLVAAVPA